MMRELSVNEMEQVSGGWNPWIWVGIGYVTSNVTDAFLTAYTGSSLSDHLEPAFRPVSPHDAYYDVMYISP